MANKEWYEELNQDVETIARKIANSSLILRFEVNHNEDNTDTLDVKHIVLQEAICKSLIKLEGASREFRSYINRYKGKP